MLTAGRKTAPLAYPCERTLLLFVASFRRQTPFQLKTACGSPRIGKKDRLEHEVVRAEHQHERDGAGERVKVNEVEAGSGHSAAPGRNVSSGKVAPLSSSVSRND